MNRRRNFASRMSERQPVTDKQAFSALLKEKTDGILTELKKGFSAEILITKLNHKKKVKRRFHVADVFLEPEKTETENNTGFTASSLEIPRLTERQKEARDKAVNILFIAGTVYFCFLTFGVWMTSYHYDDSGKISAQPMSYEDIAMKKSFEILIDQYIECRNLYEKVLAIDKKIAEGKVQPFTLAPDYESIVSDAENLYTKTEALSIDVRYEQIRSMYLTWIKDNLATYCKNMSAAISQNNETIAQTALDNRKLTYNNFSLITQNIIAMGEAIPGIDLVNIREWDATDIYKTN